MLVKSVADSLKGATEDDTAKNISTWVHDNIKYERAYANLDTYSTLKCYYDTINTHKTICKGQAMMINELTAMNGLTSRIGIGTANGGAHAWATIFLNNIPYDVDVTSEYILFLPHKYNTFQLEYYI